MSWLVILPLFFLLCWQVLNRAYQGPTGRLSLLALSRNIVVIALLFIFALVVLCQLIVILKSG